MGLKEEERRDLVKYRLEKAYNTFAEIQILLDNKLCRTAANRLYYACFYAATALLINDRHETHTHHGVKTLLGLHYVKEGKIENAQGNLFKQLFNLRQKGDYEDWIDIDENTIIPLIEPAKNFIAEIEKLINNTLKT